MQDPETVQPAGGHVTELGGRATVGKHRALARTVDEHHDRACGARALCAHINAV